MSDYEDLDLADEDVERLESYDSKCMVCFVPPDDIKEQLSLEGGEPLDQLHITLAYLGECESLDQQLLEDIVRGFAAASGGSLELKASGIGIFDTEDDGQALVALIDAPGIDQFYLDLCVALESEGLPVSHTHGFTPHLTRDYVLEGEEVTPEMLSVPNVTWTQNTVSISWGHEITDFELGGEAATEEEFADPDASATLPSVPDLLHAHVHEADDWDRDDWPTDEWIRSPTYDEYIVGIYPVDEYIAKTNFQQLPVSDQGYYAAYFEPDGQILALTAHAAAGNYDENYRRGAIRLVVYPDPGHRLGMTAAPEQLPNPRQMSSIAKVFKAFGCDGILFDRWPGKGGTFATPSEFIAWVGEQSRATETRSSREANWDRDGYDTSQWQDVGGFVPEFYIGVMPLPDFIAMTEDDLIPVSDMGYYAAYVEPDGQILALTAHRAAGDYDDNWERGAIRLVAPPKDPARNTFGVAFSINTNEDQLPNAKQVRTLIQLWQEFDYDELVWDRWPEKGRRWHTPTEFASEIGQMARGISTDASLELLTPQRHVTRGLKWA